MKTKHNFMKKLMLFAAAFAFCAVVCAQPIDVNAAVAAPTVTQTAANSTAVGVEWNAIADATKYGVMIATTPDFAGATEKFTTYTSAALSGLTPGSTYYVTVKAYTATESSAWSAAITADTAPSNITWINQTNATETTVTYSWSPVAGATGYFLFKALPNGSYEEVGPTTATSYTMSVPKNSVYYVTVAPFRNNALFPISNDNMVETYCVPLPTKPSNLDVISGDPDSKTLSFYWKPTSIAENTSGYEVEVYQLKTNGKTKRLKKTSIVRSNYEYFGCVIKHKSFFNNACKFRVRAYATINGNKVYGAWSSSKNYVPQAHQTSLKFNSRTSATLKWNKVNGAASYDIYYKTSKYSSWKRIAKNVKGTSYSVKANYYGDSYYYVKANKVKCGKKKLNSSAPTKAPYVIYWN